ncbi:GntR family transcriptional regulator [Gemmatimonadota bacterium]
MRYPQPEKSMKTSLLSERVYEEIRTWIINGQLAPGEDLKDSEIAEHLGISRTPVREAIRRLMDDGLVQTSANRWTRVAGISVDEIDQLIPIVNCLEALSLSQALPFMIPDGIKEMEEANLLLKKSITSGDYTTAAEANRSFHYAFIARSGNTELEKVIMRVKIKIRRMGVFYFSSNDFIPADSVIEHDTLIQFVLVGDIEQSQLTLKQHWENVAKRMKKSFESGNTVQK